MDILLQPNVAYLLLAGGIMLAILAVLSPGTGLFEIGAIISLLLAGYAIYNLPINLWALLILVVGVVFFIISVRRTGKAVHLLISIAALVVGSAFLFRSEVWWRPAVNPALALLVSVISGGFLWLVARKIMEAESSRPTHDLEALIGAVGEAKTEVRGEGSVYVNGELWSAHSEKPIPAGAKVRVAGREGLILLVEPVNLPLEQKTA
jgi:membrane-bound serine protease (ClpP class)